MTTPDQVYKITITATPDKVWEAIINPEFTKQYWFGSGNVAAKWEKGASWEHKGMESGIVHHLSTILEIDKPRRLVLSWGNPNDDKDVSRVTFELVENGNAVDLTIIHGDFVDGSPMATRVAGGWPKVIANMRAYLEHGAISGPKPAHSSCACA